MPLVLAKGSKTPSHSDENNGAVASLPRDQRCWHTLIKAAPGYGFARSHRFREINAVGTSEAVSPVLSTMVASLPRDQRCWHCLLFIIRDHDLSVASLPKLQRCWHSADMPERYAPTMSHRFRNINVHAGGSETKGTASIHTQIHACQQRIECLAYAKPPMARSP